MTSSGLTRRQFTLTLASGASIAAAQGVSGAQQEESVEHPDKPHADPASDGDDPPSSGSVDASKESDPEDEQPHEADSDKDESDEPPEAAWVLGWIMRRYADERLDDAAVSGIASDIYRDLARSRTLSSFPLSNSDEPAFIFRARRAESGPADQ